MSTHETRLWWIQYLKERFPLLDIFFHSFHADYERWHQHASVSFAFGNASIRHLGEGFGCRKPVKTSTLRVDRCISPTLLTRREECSGPTVTFAACRLPQGIIIRADFCEQRQASAIEDQKNHCFEWPRLMISKRGKVVQIEAHKGYRGQLARKKQWLIHVRSG